MFLYLDAEEKEIAKQLKLKISPQQLELGVFLEQLCNADPIFVW